MSGTNSNSPPGANGGGDPSMEDILASIRRILAEDDPPPDAAEQAAEVPAAEGDEVLVLDSSMRKSGEPGAAPEAEKTPAGTAPAPSGQTPVVAKLTPVPAGAGAGAASASGAAFGGAARSETRRGDQPSINHTSLEDAVRAAFEQTIREWLDAALPKMTERMVRTEVERIVGGVAR